MSIEYIRCDKCKNTQNPNSYWAKIKGIDGKRLHLCQACYKQFMGWIGVGCELA